MPLDPCVRIGTIQIFRNNDDLEQLQWPRCVFLANSLLKSHQRSLEATNGFLSITLDWKDVDSWEWLHCVCLIKMHRLICNMIYFGYYVTLTWDQILTLTFQGQLIYLSNSVCQRNTVMPLSILYLNKFKSYSWNNISPITAILTTESLLSTEESEGP